MNPSPLRPLVRVVLVLCGGALCGGILSACPTGTDDGPTEPQVFTPDSGAADASTGDAGRAPDAGDAGNNRPDAATRPDAAMTVDASMGGMDAGLPRTDAGTPDAGPCTACFEVPAGFPVVLPITPARLGAVAAGDVTGDGNAEWVVALDSEAHDQGAVLLVNADGTTQVRTAAGGLAPSGPVLVDLNGDGTRDVVAANFRAALEAFTFAGPALVDAGWPVTLGPAAPAQGLASWAEPGVGNVFNVSVGGVVHRVGMTGAPVDGWPNEVTQQPLPDGVTACQLNAGASLELAAVGLVEGRVAVVAMDNTGLFLPGFPTTIMLAGASFAPTCVDVDGDGVDEIALAEDRGLLHLLGADGAQRAGFPVTLTGGGPSSQVSAGDVNGDGRPELVVATRRDATAGRLWAVNAAGVLPGFPVDVDAPVPGAVLVADVDGTGGDELVAVTLLANLVITDGSGVIRPGYPRSVGGNPVGAPALADLDGDGRWELAVPTLTRLIVGELPAGSVNLQRTPWTRYRGHDGRTGRYRGESGGP